LLVSHSPACETEYYRFNNQGCLLLISEGLGQLLAELVNNQFLLLLEHVLSVDLFLLKVLQPLPQVVPQVIFLLGELFLQAVFLPLEVEELAD
jgi:hypothetical protein